MTDDYVPDKVRFPEVQPFGHLAFDDYLAKKQKDVSDKLCDLCQKCVISETFEARNAVIAKLADLLQTLGNLCESYAITSVELDDAMKSCWEKNMAREKMKLVTDKYEFYPNQRVYVLTKNSDGVNETISARIAPSDCWLDHISEDKIGIMFSGNGRHICGMDYRPLSKVVPADDSTVND